MYTYICKQPCIIRTSLFKPVRKVSNTTRSRMQGLIMSAIGSAIMPIIAPIAVIEDKFSLRATKNAINAIIMKMTMLTLIMKSFSKYRIAKLDATEKNNPPP